MRRGLLKQGMGTAVALGATLAVIGSGVAAQSPAPASETFTRIQQDGVARVGFINEAPFAYSTMEKITGEAPEILRVALAPAGVERLEGVLTEWASLIPSLVANRIDMIGAGMFVRPTRCEEIDFGDPEYQLGSGFAVKTGNPLGLTKLQDVTDKTARLGLVTGGAEVEFANIAGVPKEQQVLFPDGPTAIAALQADQIDVYMVTTLSLRDLIAKAGDPNISFQEMSEQPLDADGNVAVGYGAMGFRKEDDDLRKFYNQRLAELKASGELLAIMEPFGFGESEMTDVKATDICPDIS